MKFHFFWGKKLKFKYNTYNAKFDTHNIDMNIENHENPDFSKSSEKKRQIEEILKNHTLDEIVYVAYKTELDKDEPLLDEASSRYTMLPINPRYKEIWDLYKKHLGCFWRPEDIDFENDYDDFKKLNSNEQLFIKNIFAFFASSDSIVNFNISKRFMHDVKATEAVVFYQLQTIIENIHSEVYAMQINNIVKDENERAFIFDAFKNIDVVKDLMDWCFKWINSSDRFAYRLLGFLCVEYIFFSGAFAAVYWLKQTKTESSHGSNRTFMEGLVKSNNYIARDEGLHCTFGILLWKLLEWHPPKEQVIQILQDALKIANKFMIESLKINLIGMNAQKMIQYQQYLVDTLLLALDIARIYNVSNPFIFMEKIGFIVKGNQFEVGNSEYRFGTDTSSTLNFDDNQEDF